MKPDARGQNSTLSDMGWICPKARGLGVGGGPPDGRVVGGPRVEASGVLALASAAGDIGEASGVLVSEGEWRLSAWNSIKANEASGVLALASAAG